MSTSDRAAEVLAEFEAGVRAHLGPRVFDDIDGRVANRLRNQDKVIDALVELVREGKSGTVDEVVERSGVARRSVFRHFSDLGDLTLNVFHRVLADSMPEVVVRNIGQGTQDERLHNYIDARLRSVQLMKPFRAAARTRWASSETLPVAFLVTIQLVRNQITTQFAAELRDLSEPDVERFVDTLSVLTSPESFELLTDQVGRTVEHIRTTWTNAVRMVLVASGSENPQGAGNIGGAQ